MTDEMLLSACREKARELACRRFALQRASSDVPKNVSKNFLFSRNVSVNNNVLGRRSQRYSSLQAEERYFQDHRAAPTTLTRKSIVQATSSVACFFLNNQKVRYEMQRSAS